MLATFTFIMSANREMINYASDLSSLNSNNNMKIDTDYVSLKNF